MSPEAAAEIVLVEDKTKREDTYPVLTPHMALSSISSLFFFTGNTSSVRMEETATPKDSSSSPPFWGQQTTTLMTVFWAQYLLLSQHMRKFTISYGKW